MDTNHVSFDMKEKKTIIFDLDGTLVDIEPIFIKIFNTLAKKFGYAPIHPEEIPTLKKLRLKSLIWRCLGFRILLFPIILKRGREEYHKLIPEVKLFSDMKEMIFALRSQSFIIGIVSSSDQNTITALMKKFAIPIDFIYHCSIFNKAKTLKRVLKERQLTPSETLYIGDEVRDIEACNKCDMDIISVSWGLNSEEALRDAGAETIVASPSLLLEILTRNR